MENKKQLKKRAAKKAANLVEEDMKVGLGSGSTLAQVVKELGNRDLNAEFVVASEETEEVARNNNLKILELEEISALDLTIDGADEVDKNLDLVKGGGGAHTREKIVANAAEELLIVVDESKLVRYLGEKSPIPLEVVPFSAKYLQKELDKMEESAQIRKNGDELYLTDNGNPIIDVEIPKIEDSVSKEKEFNQIPGVVENGIFSKMTDLVFVGHQNGVDRVDNGKEFSKIFRKLKKS